MNDLTPAYTINPIPLFQQSQYSLRNQDVVGQIGARTEKFQSAFYPHCLSEWNKLDPEIRAAPSVAVFKSKLLSKISSLAKSVFGIHDPKGLSYITKLRVGLSALNFHKFKHNFRDTINPMCPTNDGIKDTEHFFCIALLLTKNDEIFSLESFAIVTIWIYDSSNNFNGDKGLSNDINRDILQLTLHYIHKNGRFD